MGNKISKLITETFEKERPLLCLAIKQAVNTGESRTNFDAFIKSVIPSHEMTVTYPLFLTVFDYYKSLKDGNNKS